MRRHREWKEKKPSEWVIERETERDTYWLPGRWVVVLLHTSCLGKVLRTGPGLHILSASGLAGTVDTAPPGRHEAVRTMHSAAWGIEACWWPPWCGWWWRSPLEGNKIQMRRGDAASAPGFIPQGEFFLAAVAPCMLWGPSCFFLSLFICSNAISFWLGLGDLRKNVRKKTIFFFFNYIFDYNFFVETIRSII